MSFSSPANEPVSTDQKTSAQHSEPTKQPSKDSVNSTLMFSEHWRVSLMVALITVLSIALFSGAGYWLDQSFGTHPLLLIIGVVASFPLSQFIVYRWVKKHYLPRVKNQSHS